LVEVMGFVYLWGQETDFFGAGEELSSFFSYEWGMDFDPVVKDSFASLGEARDFGLVSRISGGFDEEVVSVMVKVISSETKIEIERVIVIMSVTRIGNENLNSHAAF